MCIYIYIYMYTHTSTEFLKDVHTRGYAKGASHAATTGFFSPWILGSRSGQINMYIYIYM